MVSPSLRCTAFSGNYRIASGELRHVALKAKQAFDAHPERPVLVFDDADARTLELPLELPPADLLAWLSRPQRLGEATAEPERPRRPGRPKLGVVPREVTLLRAPFDGIVSDRKVSAGDDRRRAAQEATYRFMQAMAGNEAGFEDAARALYAGDDGRFQACIARWPDDLREHVEWLATDAFVA